MKIALMVAGIVLIVFGVADFGGSFVGYDLWGGVIGVQLPEVVWQYSAYAEIVIGYLLYNFSSKIDAPEESDAESA